MHACALCNCRIGSPDDSREHIIPQAIGGRKTVRGFICRRCNNTQGHAWDAELAAQLNWFSVTLNVKRQAGTPPKQRVEAINGQKLWLHADSSMTVDEPLVAVDKTPGGLRYSVKPRTMTEARKKLKEIQRKHPAIDVDKEMANAVVQSIQPGAIKTSFQFGGELAGRSLVKTAVAMVYDMGIDPQACDFALRYLRQPGETPALAEFYVRDLVLNRSPQQLINSVTVCANPRKNTLSGYIEYFGVLRYVIHLSQTYSGPSAHRTYAINPATGKSAELNVALDLSSAEYASSLANETRDEQGFRDSFDYSMPIVLKSLYARQDEKATKDAITDTFEALGIKPNEEVPFDKLRAFRTLLSQKLALHFVHVMQVRPKL